MAVIIRAVIENMYTEHIISSSPYDAHIGAGLLKTCGGIIRGVFGGSDAVLFADAKVYRLYGESVLSSLSSAGINAHAFVFSGGEGSKRAATLIDSLEFAATRGLTRDDIIVALGGGVAGDLAGMCAGLYMRGIKLALLPTTLLSQADSSVGGKTAINLSAGKNLAGLFWQPSVVIADTDCLKSLDDGEYACGMAEAVKMGVLFGEELFSLCETGVRAESDAEIVRLCVRGKANITALDERDRGARMALNLGHTYAHAIEKLSEYKIAHGCAVSIGLSTAVRAAARMGDMRASECERVVSALKKWGLPTECPYSSDDISATAALDKKRESDDMTIIVPRRIGECETRRIRFSDFKRYAEAGLA